MDTCRATVLVHSPGWGRHMAELEERFSDVRFVRVDPDEPVPADLRGEVLFAQTFRPSNVADVLDHGVRWVHSIGHGVDHLPLDLMGDMLVSCSRGASAAPIAEWVVAMILTAVKDLPDSWADEPPERWSWASLGSVEGQTVALIGFGSINRAVADRLRPFGAHLTAVRRSGSGTDYSDVHLTSRAAEAVRDADHVVVAVPVTGETHHFVDAALLSEMKPGAHLINVARGSVVDQDALRTALDSGHVGLASLDVSDPEPLPAGHWLYRHPGVRLSPHISWSSPDSVQQLFDMFADNLERWLQGDAPEGLVGLEAGY
ncbi:MAG: NAD(P)-dependent oxidoreductase [Acidimicrobiales bacterium]|jgi:phosphoglycerate dehydrogenase-like enzyme|nr:NAD(P)-dependent oxidoreductase [Acidimicrobiales bacterium]|tara:strand:- start:9760 stop:10707 length:948 start_codon:yes stop_codon:yes gene_type:complete